VKLVTTDLQKTLLIVCEFHENRIKEDRTFLMGVNKNIFTRVTSSHGAYDLQSWFSFHNTRWIAEKALQKFKGMHKRKHVFYKSRPSAA
jgi:hypothetical protein